jgi:phenylacetic acid degradation operon negative regulatory protein
MRPILAIVELCAVTAPGLAAAGDLPVVDLPRRQVGAQPQRLLTTLLGDYWYGRPEHIPSVVLVRLLADFGVSTMGARAALSRLARRGLLESSRVGRNTYYGLTATAAEVIRESAQRILSFGQRHDLWDGRWTVAAFSIPEEMRDVRHALRSRLRWLGFAPLYDGMWVTPRPVAEPARRAFADLGVVSFTVLTTVVESRRSGPRPPIAAWDLTDLQLRYEEFIVTYSTLLDRIRLADVDSAEALVARTSVMDAWRRFPSLDPDLPLDLLPERWPRRAARAVFAEIYDGLAPHAVARVRELVAAVAPDLAPLVSRHTAVG